MGKAKPKQTQAYSYAVTDEGTRQMLSIIGERRARELASMTDEQLEAKIIEERGSCTPAQVLEAVRALSAGTLATASGLRDYAALDHLSGHFYEYTLDRQQKGLHFGSWQDAWHQYRYEANQPLTCLPGCWLCLDLERHGLHD